MLLLNKNQVTAAELSRRFGVSTRTIYRDIDTLSAAGVPVYATQGMGGGISVMEQYTVSRTLLNDNERDSILFALKTLQSTKYPEIDGVLDKLASLFKQPPMDWIAVDFTPWGANPNAYAKFTDIRTAILQCRVIELEYINARNEKSRREIEPLRLIFKSQAWYIWGYCLTRQDYRTFRISRVKHARLTERVFKRDRVRPSPVRPPQEAMPCVHLVLEFTEKALYRLYDDYDESWLTRTDDGLWRLEIDLPDDEWLYGYVLSFGPQVTVVSPEHVRRNIRARCAETLQRYTELY